jgi:hypothetical protein
MTKVLVDAETQGKLLAPEGFLEVCDCSGRTLGYFVPVGKDGGMGVRSPFSDEEIQKRRQQRTGKPLAEILQRLE